MTALHPILSGGKKPYVEGHRGAPNYGPENTIASFKKAVEIGCDLIEIDVQLSKDQEIVVFHDEKLGRTSDGSGFLKDFTLTELQQLDVGSWFSSEYTGERMPTLEEVLDWAKGKIWLSIEMKNVEESKDILVKKTVELIQSYKMEEQVQIISFNHDMLAQVRQYSKKIMLSAITPCRLVDPVRYLKSFDAQVLNGPGEYLTKELVEELHQAGLYVNGGMVNDVELWEKLEAYGVDLMCTNVPELMFQRDEMAK